MGVQWTREKVAQGGGWMATLVLGAGALFFAWLAYSAYSGLEESPENKANWALEFLKFYAYVVGGIILIWQVRIANRRATALEKTAALGEKGNITERFKNAIEHLANKSESIRIGGIYGLYHVAREANEYVDAVCKILCVHARIITTKPKYAKNKEPTQEIAAILDILFPSLLYDENRNVEETLFTKANIAYWYLRGADIYGRNMENVYGANVNLSEALMSEVDLTSAYLMNADLSRADLSHAQLWGACLMEANLQGANLTKASLRKADLTMADLSEANLSKVDLSKASLHKANLSGADLSRVDLLEADLSEANLSGAILWGTQFPETIVTVDQLLEAHTLYEAELDDKTREEILRRKPELLDIPADFLAELPDHVRDAIMEKSPELLDKPK